MDDKKFYDDSREVLKKFGMHGASMTDEIDKMKRESEAHEGYYGYLKDFLVSSALLCDDIFRASQNDAVLLAQIGVRTIIEDTINVHYLESKKTEAKRMKIAKSWIKITNDPKAYKNKVGGISVADRAIATNDHDVKNLHDGEYADWCNYTHSTAQRSILVLEDHKSLAAKKGVMVAIKAYANIVGSIARILNLAVPDDLNVTMSDYLNKYREDVATKTLSIPGANSRNAGVSTQ